MKLLFKTLSAIMLFTLPSCSLTKKTETQNNDTIIAEERSYSEVSDYELLWDTMFDVESSFYYVYFYSLTCNHCAEIKNYMIEKALERGNIYFIKSTSRDQLTTDQNKSKNAENPGDIWILGYPSLIVISNKKCTKNLAGISQIKQELK